MIIPDVLASELSLPLWQINNALELFAEGGTVPFIARYRKERTGGMNEVTLRTLQERYQYLVELNERKETILKSIDEQGKLTDELKDKIENTTQKAELEDLYLPYKPRRRTRATAAREKGLEPLASWIQLHNTPEAAGNINLKEEASRYVDAEKGVASVEEALQGASDIIAEEIAETAEYRAYIRDYLLQKGIFASRIREDFPEGSTQYEMYRDYKVPVSEIAAHNMLALRRGESEGVLYVSLEFDEKHVLGYLIGEKIFASDPEIRDFLINTIEDAFRRLMKLTLIGEVRLQKKQEADLASIQIFAANLRELLLSSPAGMRPTIGIDPGFRTGCKIAVLDNLGRFIENLTIYPHASAQQREEASRTLLLLIEKYRIELIAIGNGTAGRETEQFVSETISNLEHKPIQVMVNESGASVYSASPVAIEEFPDLDVTVRGAISIGRRLQDPLAELVKIDPKSIGVGQYQHDVDQSLLKQKLEETVESCVNYVGVDLNMASRELLRFVAGISPALADNIVKHRNTNGAFARREDLLEVDRFGPKTFEQAAGFLRIRNGINPLDNTAVHPESYGIVESMARDLGVSLNEITRIPHQVKKIDLKRYTTDTVGEPTLLDIIAELEKPGRDPRAEFRYASFRDDVKTIEDLKPGMELEGVVTNVANFGAFVDIGVHRDGLVHISQLANRFVKDPTEIVKVGQVVKVRVLEVDQKLNRISLSMKQEKKIEKSHPKKKKRHKEHTPHYTIDDLVKKFNRQ